MKKNVTPCYAVLQALVWGGFGVIISYAASYFLNQGLTDSQYGLLLGLVSAASFGVQLVLAEGVSRCRRMTLRLVLASCGVIGLLCCGALCLLPLPLPAVASLFCLAAVVVQVLPSLVNTLGMAGLQSGLSVNFGIGRGIGSLSFALVSWFTGKAITLTGTWAVPAIYALLCAVLIVMALVFPNVSAGERSKERGGSLYQNRKFLLLIAGATLLLISHNLICNFLYQINVSRGGDEASQGICSAIAAMCELPVMFFFHRMLRRGRCDSWLKLAGLFMAVKAGGILLAASIGGLYAAMLAQTLGYGLYTVASVYYVGSLVEEKDVARGQAMLASCTALSNLVSFVTGGTLMSHGGIQVVMAVSLGCALLGSAVLIVSLQKIYIVVGASTDST